MSNQSEKDTTINQEPNTEGAPRNSQESNSSYNGGNKNPNSSIDKSSFDAISQFFIDLLMKLGEFFKRPTGSYKDNPEMQQSAKNSINEMSEASNELKEKGDYTGAYLMERQKIYVEALHETAMERDYSPKEIDLLAEDAGALAAVKIDELNKSELGQVARNDYMSDLSESSLASIHDNVNQQASSIYREHFVVETQEIISRISGSDLNNLINEQNSPPLSPNEKENGVKQEMDVQMDYANQREYGVQNNPTLSNLEPSTPGPGR